MSMCKTTFPEEVKKKETDYWWWCPVPRKEAIATNGNKVTSL